MKVRWQINRALYAHFYPKPYLAGTTSGFTHYLINSCVYSVQFSEYLLGISRFLSGITVSLLQAISRLRLYGNGSCILLVYTLWRLHMMQATEWGTLNFGCTLKSTLISSWLGVRICSSSRFIWAVLACPVVAAKVS